MHLLSPACRLSRVLWGHRPHLPSLCSWVCVQEVINREVSYNMPGGAKCQEGRLRLSGEGGQLGPLFDIRWLVKVRGAGQHSKEVEGSEGMSLCGPAKGPVGAEATPTVEEEPGLQALDRLRGEAVYGAGRGRQQAVRLQRVTEVWAQRAGPRSV